MINTLTHGSTDGPKQDTGSWAKRTADTERARLDKLKREQEEAVWLYNLEREVS